MRKRSCVGCRQARDPAELVRLCNNESTIVRGSGSGRGAWVGPSRACVELAVRRKAISRGLRVEVNATAVAKLLDSWPPEPSACPHGEC